MDKLFDSRPVYIIGGGASLRGFDWNRLKRRQTIAINNAHRVVPWADVMFFGDNRYFEDNLDPGGQHFWRFKGSHIFTTASYCGGMEGRIEYLRPESLALGDVDPATPNSGAQAILLAHQLGAERIVLLGFDNKPGHWAAGTHLAHQGRVDPKAFERYGAGMEKVAKLGLNIVNANEASALTCFPVVPRDTAI